MATRKGPLPACGFLVTATKNGQVPLSIEKRAKGKKVTVIQGVQGNASALCATLTALLGVGGSTNPKGPSLADVEVQGEQFQRVESALVRLGCVRGLPATRETATTVVQRDYAYDAVLTGPTPGRKQKTEPVVIPVPPEDAPCRSWHGHWMYCRGHCEQVDTSGMWLALEESNRPVFRPAARPVVVDDSSLHSALRDLGMLAEPGPEVREWHARRMARDQDSVRRRVDPTPSVSAPPRVPGLASKSAVKLKCEECGATFSLRATLEKHRRQHQADREAAARGQQAADVQPAEDSSWRGSTYEQSATAAAAEEEEAWEGDWNEEGSAGSDVELRAPAHTFSLDSYVSRGAKQSKSKGRQARGRGAGTAVPGPAPAAKSGKGFSAVCPICSFNVPLADIERHVEECLELSQAVSDSQVEVPDSSQAGDRPDSRSPEDDVLSADLLESLLELELSEEATSRFWHYFDRANQAPRAIASESFLNALSQVLLEDSENDGFDAGDVAASGRSGPATDGCHGPRNNRWGREARSAPVVNGSQGTQAVKATFASASPCPLCGVVFAEDRIERHVEECLEKCNASAVHPTSKSGPAAAPARPTEEAPLSRVDGESIVRSTGPLLAKDVLTWLRKELVLIIGEDDTEGLLAGVEVILGDCDADGVANAREIMACELPQSEHSDAVLVQFCELMARVSNV